MARATPAKPPISQPADSSSYTVVARRYRPQRFGDVVGQDHVVQALRNAIRMNRVTHAYLFSGTRGVGKTSMARIFAKCLNCVRGPTDEPCLECDICQAIAVGQDIDVSEIDGASNNGVESVRELRQNASLRPSRARFKIYYIDEVHMLSTGAFNALLKTLEEPPEHVKFFFATTEPNKIPITVLSRCQRFDFAGITTEQIVSTLAEICANERVDAEPEALHAVARRAGGSMRDAQSLLEQLMSSAGARLTVDAVHQLLGTASDERLLDLIDALADHDSARVLDLTNQAVDEGVQTVDLLGGLIDFLADGMRLSAGSVAPLLATAPRQRPRLEAVVARWPFDSIVSALQILADARLRMRGSPHGRVVVEVALVKVARLENLVELSDLVGRLSALETGSAPPNPAAPTVKKKIAAAEPEPPRPQPSAAPPREPAAPREPAPAARIPARPLELNDVHELWPSVLEKLSLRLRSGLGQVLPTAISAPGVLVIELAPRYNWIADECGSPEALERIEKALEQVLERPMSLRFDRVAESTSTASAPPPAAQTRRDEVSEDPMVQKVVELFEARPIHLEVEDDSPRASGA